MTMSGDNVGFTDRESTAKHIIVHGINSTHPSPTEENDLTPNASSAKFEQSWFGLTIRHRVHRI